jgi:nitroreductase
MFTKAIETAVPLHDLLANRWSGRGFDPQRTVAQDTLLALLEAARWSPSCFGDQPWRLLIWDRNVDKVNWQLALNCLGESNQVWARAAPLLMLICASTQFSHNGKANRWAEYDTGAAALALSIQATAMGLMVHQMGGFDKEAIQRQFQIPEFYAPMAMIAIGYQLSPDEIPEPLREREFAARDRKPLAAMFYLGRWGEGIKT